MNPSEVKQSRSPEEQARDDYYNHLYMHHQQEQQLQDLVTLTELPEDFEFHQEFYQTHRQPSQL